MPGKVVSGWKVSPDMKWTLIGKRDPQLAQMFYPAEDLNIEVGLGDTLAARCTMVSIWILYDKYSRNYLSPKEASFYVYSRHL